MELGLYKVLGNDNGYLPGDIINIQGYNADLYCVKIIKRKRSNSFIGKTWWELKPWVEHEWNIKKL